MTATQPNTETVTAERSLLEQLADETARIGSRYIPTLTVKQFTEREKLLRELKEMLMEGVDYGVIPGTEKPTLLLPGAQKICTFFGYVPHYEVRQIEEWTPEKYGEPLFYYDYTCVLLKDRQGVGEGRGSCNSWESKYRFRWVSKDIAERRADFAGLPTRGGRISEPVFAIDKAETGGKYGKPMAHWQAFRDAIEAGTALKTKRDKKGGGQMDCWEIDSTLYRIPNDGFPDVINTCQKMGQKRAYIAATLSATGASQYFTQDLEDVDLPGVHGEPPPPKDTPPVRAEGAPPNAGQTGESPTGGSTLPPEVAAIQSPHDRPQDHRRGTGDTPGSNSGN